MTEEMDAIFVTDKSRDDSISCKYNMAIACDSRSNLCDSCGWNPAVEVKRKEKVRRMIKEWGEWE
jgi:anaerobic ribonucleoside-triphosphate reductase